MKAMQAAAVGNQLPILLIDFSSLHSTSRVRWESVTNPLDRLPERRADPGSRLGISYQSS